MPEPTSLTLQEPVSTVTYVEHPALIQEESYLIASTSQGAVSIVNLHAKNETGDWNLNVPVEQTRIQDFPAQGVEGDADYQPMRSVIKTPAGEFTLPGVQIAQDNNDARLSAVVDHTLPQLQKYGVQSGDTYLVLGLRVNAYIQAQIVAQMQAQQGS